MAKLECDICLEDINAYYDISADLVYINQQLLFMASGHPQGIKSLLPGRVVILRDGVSTLRTVLVSSLYELKAS